MNIMIREAQTSDYDDLCVIYSELDSLHRRRHPELFVEAEGPARSKEYFESIIFSESSRIFVALAESKVVGFAECYIATAADFPVIRKRKWVQIDNIAVLEEYQNRHIATLLLNSVKEWSREKSINRLELKVYDFNEPAIGFYLSKGFENVSRNLFCKI